MWEKKINIYAASTISKPFYKHYLLQHRQL